MRRLSARSVLVRRDTAMVGRDGCPGSEAARAAISASTDPPASG
ncbi:hypothetical protein ACAG24_012265 [Mycobacterium sp. pW049]